MVVALTKSLTFFKNRKLINFSQLNSTNFNDNFKDNFMRKKVEAKTLNIRALEPN